MSTISLCNDWQFTPTWTEDFGRGQGHHQQVRLPHTSREIPLHHPDNSDYQLLCGYRRTIDIPAGDKGSRYFLRFDGAAHEATVFVNGQQVAFHQNGYTAFSVDITDSVTPGQPAQVAVRLDSRESCNQPPFGGAIDYLTFGGLYREVWLEVKGESHLQDVFVRTPQLSLALVDVAITQPGLADSLSLAIHADDGTLVAEKLIDSPGAELKEITLPVRPTRPWSPESPTLYTLRVTLSQSGRVLDQRDVPFGFRTAEFRTDGFYLNGVRYKIRGLNRHQSYPYVGYAMPTSVQVHDAHVLKRELQVNAVRTSHYPQSQSFIDACDRLGLLVFTEIPGWQHIGDEAWKAIAVQNTTEMVQQYRNHPSIVLWGVRVNESPDDAPLYRATNQAAHALDQSRQTAGVRYIWRSEPIEDVYCFNDFSHEGTNRGLLPRRLVSSKASTPYLISEFNGHMFPTKSYDSALHRQDQALRYATVLDQVQGKPGIAGSFGWCMADYQTHADFGSGDGICYHGVLDIFRNPKLAASVYASAGQGAPVLAISSSMAIGDYPAGRIGDNYAFTNADSVRVYKDDRLIRTFPATSKRWRHLAHPPVLLEDTVGDELEVGEGFPHRKAEALKASLLAVAKHGQVLPPLEIVKAAWRLFHYRLSISEAMRLFLTYFQTWGAQAPTYRYEAIREGKTVAVVERGPKPGLRLEVSASVSALVEGPTYDAAAVRIRVVDAYGNTAHYAQVPVTLTLEGDAELIGPNVVVAEGGLTGTYLRSVGRTGTATLTVGIEQAEAVSVTFDVTS